MQSLGAVTTSDLLGKVQNLRYKFELYVDSAWVDLCALSGENYVKSLSVSPSGSGPTPEVVAGTWSAEIANPNGIFHPFHPTSTYKDYLRIGRKVRISFGAVYGGTAYYWQRLIGYMDAPQFDAKSRTASVSGCDYSKRLADTIIASPDNYWGDSETFDSISSSGVTGSELYVEADALDTASEANNMTNWGDTSNATMLSYSDTGGGSTYVGRFLREAAPGAAYSHNAAVASVGLGIQYQISYGYKRVVGTTYSAALKFYQTIGTTLTLVATRPLTGTTWTTDTFTLTAIKTGALEARLYSSGGAEFDEIRIDAMTIKKYDPNWYRYPMPSDCNGVYLATLDGVDVWYGDADGDGGWYYDASTNCFYFDQAKFVEDGTANLVVRYFTTQALENVVADLLVEAGLYADRATALAAMDYTDPAVDISKVWFDAGASALDCVRVVCERLNYRFWFDYAGVPNFHPAVAAGTSVFDLTSMGHLSALGDSQDLDQIKNHVAIQGIDQAEFITTGDKKASRLTGSAEDATSITAYLRKTESITNDLFQDQASITAMCAAVLAAEKDPKWYADLELAFCPVPLEVGDTITWAVALDTVSTIDGGTFAAAGSEDVDGGTFALTGTTDVDGGTFLTGGVEVLVTGIIRQLSIDAAAQSLRCEVTDYF